MLFDRLRRRQSDSSSVSSDGLSLFDTAPHSPDSVQPDHFEDTAKQPAASPTPSPTRTQSRPQESRPKQSRPGPVGPQMAPPLPAQRPAPKRTPPAAPPAVSHTVPRAAQAPSPSHSPNHGPSHSASHGSHSASHAPSHSHTIAPSYGAGNARHARHALAQPAPFNRHPRLHARHSTGALRQPGPADLRLPPDLLAARRMSVSEAHRRPDNNTLKIKIYADAQQDTFALKLCKDKLHSVGELVEAVVSKLVARYQCGAPAVALALTFPDKSLKDIPLKSSAAFAALDEALTMAYIQSKGKIYLQATVEAAR